MAQDVTSDDSKNSADNNSEEKYEDVHGEPVTCDRCGEYVAVHYHPHGDFAANYAGFVAHCACSAGPKLSTEAVEGLDPRWYAEMVLEAEESGEEWLEYYLADVDDASNWVDGDDA